MSEKDYLDLIGAIRLSCHMEAIFNQAEKEMEYEIEKYVQEAKELITRGWTSNTEEFYRSMNVIEKDFELTIRTDIADPALEEIDRLKYLSGEPAYASEENMRLNRLMTRMKKKGLRELDAVRESFGNDD